MSDKDFKWDDIDSNTIFQTGECIKKEKDSYYCYIIVEVKDKSLVLINIFDGKQVERQKQDIIKNKYKRMAINAIVYRLLSSKNPLSKILTNYPKSALDNIVRDYAMQICINVNEKRGLGKHKSKDYPAIIVAAKPKFDASKPELANYVVIDFNDKWFKSSWNRSFLDLLKNKKVSLGAKRFDTKANRDYTFGNCAEQHAANALVTLNPDINLDKLEFSKAIRPRTGEMRNYCENCCLLFNLTN